MHFAVKIISAILLAVLFASAQPAAGATHPTNVYFFYGDGCPHCAQERQYLLYALAGRYPDLTIYEFEIYNSVRNSLLLQQVAERLGVGVDGVPFLVIGDKIFVGYADGVSSQMIEQRVRDCASNGCPDSVSYIVGVPAALPPQPAVAVSEQNEPIPSEIAATGTAVQPQTTPQSSDDANTAKLIALPLFGEIDAANFSLPVLTVIMGALDGFNPCAMWTLLFLISLLLGMKNRKRMWLLGSAFIVASASVYFLFMSAWLNLILFLGFVLWIRILIGLLAILGGYYSIYKFVFDKNSGCKICDDEQRQNIFLRLKNAVQQNSLWLALGGIILLAFAVNLVELICSAGLPAVYTQVLALNKMAGWQYYLYILLYIFFFMLDDLFVFFMAMVTLEMTGITTKYARASRLFGGLIMLAIGLMLIFKPGWLMFGY